MRADGQTWDLFWMLTRTEFRMRDQGTWLGFLWTLLHPLFHFMILYALFTHWMGSLVEHYPAYLLIGLVQWNFFSTATTAGITSLRRKAGLIGNFAFPHVLIVLSSISAVLISHLLEWGLVLAALLLMGIEPRTAWLALPFLIALELAFVITLATVLSILSAGLRDVDRAWEIILYGLFFMTPIFYSAKVVAGTGRLLIAANPLALVIEAARAVLLGTPVPQPRALLLTAGAAAITCLVSVMLFPSLSRGVAEKL